MYLLGLTGPLASGKSTVAKMLAAEGVPVLSADVIVHKLESSGMPECIAIIKEFGFGYIKKDGGIDRQKLGEFLIQNPQKMATLEDILHPAVNRELKKELTELDSQGRSLVVLEIPLMFKTGSNKLCDSVIGCLCPPEKRHQRAMQREGMSEEKWQLFSNHQRHLENLENLVDHIINTDETTSETKQTVHKILHDCLKRQGERWPEEWNGMQEQ